jgi:hypothetical protein
MIQVQDTPQKPDGLEVLYVGPDSIALRWPVIPEVGMYKLFRLEQNERRLIYSGPNVSYVDSGLESMMEYSYVLRVKNSVDISPFSDYVSARTALAIPNPPQFFLVSAFGSDYITLSWVADRLADEYEVVRLSQDGKSFITVYKGTALSATDSNLIQLTLYTYKIRSINATGTGAFNNQVIYQFTKKKD